jgi:hypothetical protein
MRLARGLAVATALIVVGLGAACRPTQGSVTVPSATTTPLPDLVDSRCADTFDLPSNVVESRHRVRPAQWPRTPPFAVLCRLDAVSADEEVGYYATTTGTTFEAVTAYYKEAFTSGRHGYAPVEGGTILTGVIGDASYYVERLGPDAYAIVWAIDGNYRDDYVLDK